MLDIITINFNGSRDTIELVESILSDSFTDFNIILVDNKSCDAEYDDIYNHLSKYDIIKKEKSVNQKIDTITSFEVNPYVRVHLIKAKENYGFSGGNNIGVFVAKYLFSDFKDHHVLFINNDVVVPNGVLKKCVEIINNSKEHDIAISPTILNYYEQTRVWFDGGRFVKWKANSYHSKMGDIFRPNSKLQQSEFLCGCFIMHAASLFEKYSLVWDERYFLYCEDLDYSLKLLKNNAKIVIIKNEFVFHKISKSTNKTPFLQLYYTNRNRFLVARKWLPRRYHLLFVSYLVFVRFVQSIMYRNPRYFAGIVDGILGKYGKKT